ncbi:MAG TPA: acyl-CoA dehydrogenase [Steroidobacteraceae bacterium]|nr:acyl-CoA dehydrogenase [Steroidobacteraceae bacterium]
MSASLLVARRDVEFQLYELLECESLIRLPRYAEHSRDTFDAVLDAAEKIALERFVDHNRKADLEEPLWQEGRVVLIPEVRAALDAYAEAGFLAAEQDHAIGGMQLPYTIAAACGAFFTAANAGTNAYAFLTRANASLLLAHGTPEQIERYARPQLEGRYFGTMCLSEPQAGSSLADLKTTAIPQPDGRYAIVGSKMWISAGDHELTENIVHLVLARIEGAPPGVAGISLFVVPKRAIDESGRSGASNGVRLVGLNHKMGYRGTVNCVLAFGDDEPCIGELVGRPNEGLACMFHMMNEARIGVGLGAAALGYTGYLHALAYARERLQGRPVGERDPSRPPVPIIEHADVRRMLLAQKAYVEGALALCLWAARLVDLQRAGSDDDASGEAAALLDLVTPIVKSWPSEWCLAANALAIQVLGGYGYTRDYPVEQFYRDNRLNSIHEGTHGIQALDLLGRKVLRDDGRALEILLRQMRSTIAAVAEVSILIEHGRQLDEAIGAVEQTTRALAQAWGREPALTLANATVYLDVLGTTVVAWLWLEQARVAVRQLDQGSESDAAFYEGKLRACRYFFRWELPRTQPLHVLLRSLDDSCAGMPPECF